VFSSRCASFLVSPRNHYNAYISQAARDIRGGQDKLAGAFERMDSSLRRLEIHTEVPPTTEMMDTTIQIMVGVLSILGISTKEIRQCPISELFSTSMSPLTEQCSEKYAKKLVGRNDMEDALRRLDELTDEEARMATAEALKATHAIDERATEVAEQVPSVDDRVPVASVDDAAAEVINGA
jgi:hypothetical protein